MKPEELRIGNLVHGNYYDHEDVEQLELCRIVTLDSVGAAEYPIWVEGLEESREELYLGFNPIPLTEEWLLKFGFEKKDLKHTDGSISKGIYYNYPCIVDKARLSDDDEYLFCRLVPGGINKYNYFTGIKYVHQLQNLYFVLTGEELTIK